MNKSAVYLLDQFVEFVNRSAINSWGRKRIKVGELECLCPQP